MNIKFGMDNFQTRYLKRFLNHELDVPTSVLGKFDKNDLKQLIKYLSLPNVKTIFEMQKDMLSTFSEIKNLFNSHIKDNYIIYTSKQINTDITEFLANNIDLIKKYCESSGWELGGMVDWIDLSKDVNGDGIVDDVDRKIIFDIANGDISLYSEEIIKKADINLDGKVDFTDLAIFDNYVNTGKLYFIIKQSSRKNYFPNKDMLVFINQFDGTFLYNWAISDGRGDTRDDMPHTNESGAYKIALYECTPGQKVTIAHNSSQAVRLVIGGSRATMKSNIGNFELSNIVDITLKAGDYIQYTCTSKELGTGPDVHYLCIQCPSNYVELSGSKTETLQLDTGDINFDGVIDIEDYHLLASYTATGPGSEQYHWNPTPKQLAVMNCRKDQTDPGISVKDAEYLYRFINNDPAIPSLGFSYYDITINADYENQPNVTNLLIIDGHYDVDVNIPFTEFINNDWVVHEKFFNYIFNMAINPYSYSEDISYVQKLLKSYYPEYQYDTSYFQVGTYSDKMRMLMKNYQKRKISYTKGDLNKDNTINTADLEILRNYIDDSANYTLVQKYLTDPNKYPLTPEEIIRLDQDGDGVLTQNDLDILDLALTRNYSDLMRSRADINDDGFVDEADYTALKDIIENGYAIIYDNRTKAYRKIDLKVYEIPFILGYCDVQTEATLEKEINSKGLISEVSK